MKVKIAQKIENWLENLLIKMAVFCKMLKPRWTKTCWTQKTEHVQEAVGVAASGNVYAIKINRASVVVEHG